MSSVSTWTHQPYPPYSESVVGWEYFHDLVHELQEMTRDIDSASASRVEACMWEMSEAYENFFSLSPTNLCSFRAKRNGATVVQH